MVERAAVRLSRYLPAAPLQRSRAFTTKVGAEVWIKLEGIQPTRSFKVRGALNKILGLDAEGQARGVITASAGNHGQGVAYGAMLFSIPATIYVPETANPAKVAAIKRMGASVVSVGTTYNDAYGEAQAAQARSGATFIHAFDDPDVIAGQGTLAYELLGQCPQVDTVIVPVGGGGLISGVAAYLKQTKPGVRVIGVQAAGAAAMQRSLQAGSIQSLSRVDTIADGLATTRVGNLTFSLTKQYVDEVMLVQERELLRAIRLYFEWEHLLAEPAGAAALAALLYRYTPVGSERVCLVLSGANIAEDVFLAALRAR